MELRFLHFIQTAHSHKLNSFFYVVTHLGDCGVVWIAIGAVLICFTHCLKSGSALFIALALSALLGNVLLKNIIMRQRPCWVDTSILTLLHNPSDYSFPSGHAFSSFACAFSVYLYDKNIGSILILLAIMIAFSRLYFGVHYPTDVIFGAIFGICTSFMSYRIIEYICLVNR
ncbi:MAG: phosphatase PAP2 family protein [Clostridia bacterium]|jgi:undecaprenyl-diphosphatase|nr:phosphatase PAP2 family protein [Clostridia bacterium]MCI2000303.1 phosphatase PAP2 family protein [Clostridia bacterium]MCI2015483.1 phosphatase PAP2 family protein [Clostridia bacterium]